MQDVDTNLLYCADNIEILSQMESDSVDLVYLDPPFNSSRSYFMNFRDAKGKEGESQQAAFEDTWKWEQAAIEAHDRLKVSENPRIVATIHAFHTMLREGPMLAYLVSLAERLFHMQRILKPTGSLWLHCDPTAGAYLRLLLDAIFGPENFRNEIAWKRQSAHSDAKTKFADVMDTIYFYGKSKSLKFKPQYVAHDPEYVREFYKRDDCDGRGPYRLDNMASPNARPNLMYTWKGYSYPTKGWRYSKETMQKLDEEGRIHYPLTASGEPDLTKRLSLKRYLSEQEGTIVPNVWTDISPVQARGESLGYPTQKPLALLKRIIEATTSEGDIVLDPYCGCGTAIAAAHALDRRWIGIDISPLAVNVMEKRMKGFPDLQKRKIGIRRLPLTLDQARDLAKEDPFRFQQWVCYMLLGGRSLDKKGPDKGIDGWRAFEDVNGDGHRAVIQVKGGKNVNSGDVREFCRVVDREKATLGFFVCLVGDEDKDLSKMREEAATAGTWKSYSGAVYPRVQILPVGGLLSGTIPVRMPTPHQDVAVNGYRQPQYKRRGDQLGLEY